MEKPPVFSCDDGKKLPLRLVVDNDRRPKEESSSRERQAYAALAHAWRLRVMQWVSQTIASRKLALFEEPEPNEYYNGLEVRLQSAALLTSDDFCAMTLLQEKNIALQQAKIRAESQQQETHAQHDSSHENNTNIIPLASVQTRRLFGKSLLSPELQPTTSSSRQMPQALQFDDIVYCLEGGEQSPCFIALRERAYDKVCLCVLMHAIASGDKAENILALSRNFAQRGFFDRSGEEVCASPEMQEALCTQMQRGIKRSIEHSLFMPDKSAGISDNLKKYGPLLTEETCEKFLKEVRDMMRQAFYERIMREKELYTKEGENVNVLAFFKEIFSKKKTFDPEKEYTHPSGNMEKIRARLFSYERAKLLHPDAVAELDQLIARCAYELGALPDEQEQ